MTGADDRQHPGDLSFEELVACPCWNCRLTRGCERALARNDAVLVEDSDVLVVPDVVLVEGLANGLPPAPETFSYGRGDGRSVSLFRVPEGFVPRRSPRAPSVGRNEPCTCGSGQKFKRCCAWWLDH